MRTVTRPPVGTALLVLSAMLASGCLNLGGDYEEQRLFDLEATRTGPPGEAVTGTALTVRPLRISPRFDTKELVLRTGELNWESDFYNQFFVPPQDAVTDEVRGWITSSGRFEFVIGLSGYVEPTHLIEGNVVAIYGDFRDPAALRAVIDVQFFLVDVRSEPPSILMQADLTAAKPIADRTPDALVGGWNECLTEILTELEKKLAETLR